MGTRKGSPLEGTPLLNLQIVRLPVVHRLEGVPQHLDFLLESRV